MRHKSMRQTFIVISCLIIVLVFATFGFFLLQVRQTLQENAQGYLSLSHRQTYENVEAYLRDIENIALSMCYSPSVQHYLQSDDPVKRVELFSEVQSVFTNLYYMNYAIACFSIYDADGDFLSANGSSHMGITMQDKVSSVSGTGYTTEYPANPYIGKTYGAYTLTMPVLRQRNGNATGSHIGTIVFTVEASYIREQVQAGSSNSGSLMTVTDADGKLLASSRNEAVQPRNMLVFKETSFDLVDWKLTTYYQAGALNNDMSTILRVMLLTACLNIALLLGFLWLVSLRFLRPIGQVSQFMQEVTQHPGQQQFLSEPRQFSELRTMTDSMNHMIHALDQKTKELLAQEKRTHEAELANDQLEILAYRSQINPHFLYNTLECISGMSMLYNAGEIAQLSQALSNMFRYAVKGHDKVTVEEEVAHMKEYATIIRYRFMERIKIRFHIAAKAMQVMIPCLILQPILENSVFHGLERKPGKGNIDVQIEVEDGVLVLRVQDDGLGMQPPQLREIRHRLNIADALPEGSEQGKNSIGLWNIARRLYLFYQDRATLTFESIPQKGTTVEIRLPIA